MGTPRLDRLGRYELVLELARGGMAELYLAVMRNEEWAWEKVVAIKRILPHLAEDKQFVDMFLNEARIAARLAHPNICTVFEIDREGSELFLVMEYLRGMAWDAVSARVPPGDASLRLAASVLAQAADGLHHAHQLHDVDGHATPVIHRDVSPQNLMLTIEGVCKVLDFGVSKVVVDGPRTRSGVLKGKLPYMSPEQIQGEPLDARADVFSLGIVLWEALAKESLFDRETDFLIWKAITEDDPPPLAPRGYPPAIDELLRCALARDRAARFASAKAFGEALRAVGRPLDTTATAAALRAHCGDELAARDAEVRAALRAGRTEVAPQDTLIDAPDRDGGSTVSLRSQPAVIARPATRRRWLAPAIAGGVLLVAGAIALGMRDRDGDPPAARPAVTPVVAPPVAPVDAGIGEPYHNPYLTPEDLDFMGVNREDAD